MNAKGLDIEGLKGLHDDVFAPMVRQLNIIPVEITETGVRFEVPATDFVLRAGDIVCGQSLSAISDSVVVMALFAHNEEPRIMTTVDMTTHFLRPLAKGEMEVDAIIVSNGRRMANVRVEIRQKGSPKVAAATTCAYVYV